MTASRPTRRSLKTRSALVEAARALLAEQGVQALTVKAVTDRADVAHGTFYHHFPSTEAVLAAGIEDSMREFSERMMRDFSEAEDKAWVFTASMSNTFRMLAAHPALGWMLERPHLLALALREACGPFARRDVNAMIEAGDISAEDLGRATHYWEWIMVAALVDAAAGVRDRERIEENLVELVLKVLGLDAKRIRALVDGLGKPAASRPAKARKRA